MKDIVNATFPSLENPNVGPDDSEDDSHDSGNESSVDVENIEDMNHNCSDDDDSVVVENTADKDNTTAKADDKKRTNSPRGATNKPLSANNHDKSDKSVATYAINKNSKFYDDDITNITLVSKRWILEPLYTLISILSLGLLNIINNWTGKNLRNAFVYKNVGELEKATHVAIDTLNGKKVHSEINVHSLFISEDIQKSAFVFSHNYQLYYLDEEHRLFQSIQELQSRIDLSIFLKENQDGKNDDEVLKLQQTFGHNELVIKPLSVSSRIFSILARPSASVKIFSVFILAYLRYKLYIWFVVGYLIYQLVSEIKSEQKNRNELQEAYYHDEKVLVIRNSKDGMHKKKIMDARDLVPGDLIEITDSLSIPADVVLVHGSCIVEVHSDGAKKTTRTKLPVDKSLHCTLDDIPSKNILVSGDKVIYTINHVNEGCFGIVVRTGFNTIRGTTLCSVSRSKTRSSIYMKDAYMLFTLFTLIALVTSLILLVNQKFINHNMLLASFATQICQLILVVLKPAVPMALFTATFYSVFRLSSKNIKSNDSNKLNDMGKSTTLVLDADVLADEEIGTAGFLITNVNEDNSLVFDRMIKTPQKLTKSSETLKNATKYIEACGVCHMVTKVHQKNYGSALDMNMLAASGFEVSYNVKDNGIIERHLESKQQGFSSSYKIIKYFEPSRSYPVTSVLVTNDTGDVYLYSKGEPFTFERMCEKRSLPFSYAAMVAKSANKGFKCTAVGYKKVANVNADRSELESGLEFVGFFLSNTALREGVEQTIAKLNDAQIDVITLTNDSVYLGLSHALNSGICNNIVYIARTMIVNNVETIGWQCTQRNKEPSFSTSIIETNNLIDIDLTSDELCKLTDASFAVTGPAFRLLMDKSEAVKQIVLSNCRVYSNLTTSDRLFIYSSIKNLLGSEPIVYVTNESGDINLIRHADVSVSLAPCSLSLIHSFSSMNGSVSSLIDIIQESRTTLFNRHKNFEFVCYFVILQYFGLLLLFSKNTSYATAQVFFMDILLLLAVSYFQSNLGPVKLTKEVPCRSILSRKFISSTLTLTCYGIVFMWTLMAFLWRAKFYKTPTTLLKLSNNSSQEKQLFYDPFLVFISFVYLNVRFTISNNTSVLLTKKIFKNWGFLLYMLFLMVTPFALIFANQIQSTTLKGVLKMVFKIPNLHGFEVLIIVVSLVMLCGFYLVKWIEKTYIRNIGLPVHTMADTTRSTIEMVKSTKNVSMVDKSKSFNSKNIGVKKSGLAKSFVKKKVESKDVKRDLSVSLDAGKIGKRGWGLVAVEKIRNGA